MKLTRGTTYRTAGWGTRYEPSPPHDRPILTLGAVVRLQRSQGGAGFQIRGARRQGLLALLHHQGAGLEGETGAVEWGSFGGRSVDGAGGSSSHAWEVCN